MPIGRVIKLGDVLLERQHLALVEVVGCEQVHLSDVGALGLATALRLQSHVRSDLLWLLDIGRCRLLVVVLQGLQLGVEHLEIFSAALGWVLQVGLVTAGIVLELEFLLVLLLVVLLGRVVQG